MNISMLSELGLWFAPWSALWLTFGLMLCRIAGLLAVGPILGQAILPWQVRVGTAVVLSLLITPLVRAGAFPSNDLFAIAQTGLTELGLGFLIGCSTCLVVWSVQAAGRLIEQQAGLANDVDDEASEPLSRWLSVWIVLGVLLSPTVNAPWHVITTLCDSVQTWPLGGTANGLWNGSVIAGLLHHGCRLALTIAAPTLATMMLCNVTFAMLASGTSHGIALNVAGSLRPIVGLIVLASSLSGLNQFVADELRTNWLHHVTTVAAVDATEIESPGYLADNSPHELIAFPKSR